VTDVSGAGWVVEGAKDLWRYDVLYLLTSRAAERVVDVLWRWLCSECSCGIVLTIEWKLPKLSRAVWSNLSPGAALVAGARESRPTGHSFPVRHQCMSHV